MDAAQSVVSAGLLMIGLAVSDKTEQSMINRWKKEHEAYKAKKERRQAVYDAIGEGYDTVSEIVSQTGIPQTSVHRILVELLSKNRIRSVKTKNMNYRLELRYQTASIFQ